MGYGKFGAMVTMSNLSGLDNSSTFDPRHIRLADIDGSGTTDIVYVHLEGPKLFFNQAGNSWSEPVQLGGLPAGDGHRDIQVLDLLGQGTASLVWSSPLPANAPCPIRTIDLMAEGKPHLLTEVNNNLGARTKIRYAPSTRFYLEDKAAGTPWLTKLAFPMHVVERVETRDEVSGFKGGEEHSFSSKAHPIILHHTLILPSSKARHSSTPTPRSTANHPLRRLSGKRAVASRWAINGGSPTEHHRDQGAAFIYQVLTSLDNHCRRQNGKTRVHFFHSPKTHFLHRSN